MECPLARPMLIRISHLTSYRYEPPAASVIQILRLTPRNHDGQYITRWRIDVSTDCRLDQHEDAFGNITHAFTAEGPFDELSIQVEGEVETRDTQGIVRGAVERFPPSFYLRETALTSSDPAIAEFAASARGAAGGDVLGLLHIMLDRLFEQMTFDTEASRTTTPAAEAFALKRGVCQDFAHIVIAGARGLGIPARYVSGYFLRNDGVTGQDAGHAWQRPSFPNSAGWPSMRPTGCVRRTHTSGSRSGSIASARRRCAARAMAAGTRCSWSGCRSSRRRNKRKIDPRRLAAARHPGPVCERAAKSRSIIAGLPCGSL